MDIYHNVLSLIGNTPLVELKTFDVGLCRLYLKLENQNPGGSIKDRIALSMIEVAEKAHNLNSSSVIVEATAGNTGLGLALVASQKKYRLILVVPDKMSQEKILHLKALGAEVVLTRSDVSTGHPQYYQDLAQKITRETKGGFYINQFSNPANPLAHETSTAPEIWEQTEHKLDAVVCGVGSGGTLTGLSNYFKRIAPHVEMVLADPVGSILADFVKSGIIVKPGSWLVEGIGEDFVPPIADLSCVKYAYKISDEESFFTARQILKREGILVGSSTGTLVAAAIKYCKEQSSPKIVVTFACDSGTKYLSKMYDDYWMIDQGFLKCQQFNDLRDIIFRPFHANAVISVTPDDLIATTYSRMRIYSISQLPVIANNKLVGIIDESDLLLAMVNDATAFNHCVKEYMTTRVDTIPSSATIKDLMVIFNAGKVALVTHNNEFYGLITRIDLLSFLRRKYQNLCA